MSRLKSLRPFIIASLCAAAISCGSSPDAMRADANRYLAGHQYVEARLILLNLLKADPKDRDALVKLAETALALGNGDEAQMAIRRARAEGVPRAALSHLLAETLLLNGQPEKALEEIAAIPPARAARASALKIRALAVQGNRPEALAEIASATARHANDADLMAEAARVHLAIGEGETAIGYARKATGIAPEGLEGQLILGEALLAAGKPVPASDAFATALRHWPSSVRAMIASAAAAGERGQFDAMAQMLDRSDRIDPNQPIARLLRAQRHLYFGEARQADVIVDALRGKLVGQPRLERIDGEASAAIGKPESAMAAYSRYLAMKPDDRDVRLLLADIQLRTGDAASALKNLRAIADAPDASPQALLLAAKAAEKVRDPAEARYRARAAVPAPAYLARKLIAGDAAIRDGRWVNAVDVYRELGKATGGRDAVISNNLGWALFQTGQSGPALEALRSAYRLAPDNPAIADSLGWVLYRSGKDRAEATRLLEFAARAKPESAAYRAHLADARAGK